MFDIGQPVKCIDGRWGAATGTQLQKIACPNLPQVGCVYTVRWVGRVIAVFDDGPTWFVRLVEIVNPINSRGDEPIFYAAHFVPLKKVPETDISFAHDFLNVTRPLVRASREEREYFRKKKVGV